MQILIRFCETLLLGPLMNPFSCFPVAVVLDSTRHTQPVSWPQQAVGHSRTGLSRASRGPSELTEPQEYTSTVGVNFSKGLGWEAGLRPRVPLKWLLSSKRAGP